MVCVPLLAVAGNVAVACVFIIGERFGKARPYAFATHEALDQAGALIGPLVIAKVLAAQHSYSTAFAILAVPGVLAMGVLFYHRRRVPWPSA